MFHHGKNLLPILWDFIRSETAIASPTQRTCLRGVFDDTNGTDFSEFSLKKNIGCGYSLKSTFEAILLKFLQGMFCRQIMNMS